MLKLYDPLSFYSNMIGFAISQFVNEPCIGGNLVKRAANICAACCQRLAKRAKASTIMENGAVTEIKTARRTTEFFRKGWLDLSVNYQWIAEIVASRVPVDARVLDFGCGTGRALSAVHKLKPTMETYGADTFSGIYENWQKGLEPDVAETITRIENGRIAHDDATFDLVFANQVFEHVFDPAQALEEIARVLKPGGQLLLLFPCRGTWYEGHVGIYFAHWLMGWPGLQRRYLALAHRTGAGLYRKGTHEQWAERMTGILQEACIYHRWGDFRTLLARHFDMPPEHLEHDNIAARLRHRGGSLANLLASLALRPGGKQAATLVHRLRAGRAFVVRRVKN